MHTEKTRRENKQPGSQTDLKIDAPNSTHEKEAAETAKQSVHGDQVMGGGEKNDGMINMQGASFGEQGMVAPKQVQEGIEVTKGSGEALPENLNYLLKGKTPWDNKEVRIHTDSRAAELSKAVNAKAFTHGKDIYFGQGKFDTYTSEGKELIAHELTHTVQNNFQDKRVIRRAPITTWGGSWFASKYGELTDPAENGGKPHGLEVEINFRPNDNVDATNIGLVQIARSKGAAGFIFPDKAPSTESKDRAIKPGDAVNSSFQGKDEGFNLDRIAGFANPMYATDVPDVKDDLGATERKSFWGQHGYHHYDEEGTLHHLNAVIKDKPYIRTTGPNYRQEFETAALAVSGKQAGTYYGSVQWGWQTDSTGNYSRLAFKALSQGSPSNAFMKSAQNWNAQTLAGGVKTINLFTQKIMRTTVDALPFYSDPNTLEEQFKLTKGTRVVIQEDTEAVVKDGVTYRQARIVDGEHVYTTGWLDATSYMNENDYLKTNKWKQPIK